MNVEIEKQFVPYLILEEYFKKKYLPDIKVINEFINYTASYFNVEKSEIWFHDDYEWINDQRKYCIEIEIKLKNGNFYKINFFKDGSVNGDLFIKEDYSRWRGTGFDIKSYSFTKSTKTKEFFNFYWNQYKPPSEYIYRNLQTNKNSYSLSIFFHQFSDVVFQLDDYSLDNSEMIYYKSLKPKSEEQLFNNKNKGSNKYTEEEIGKILLSLKIDISSFPEQEQEEIKQLFISTLGNLEQEEEKRLKEFRDIQINRIMLAYQKFKEIAELLNDTKMDLKFDKVKIDNLRSIIFKNNGYPTENGYIEFDDFFKNNMILRMLDLSQLDLTNVNITYMDFSGTNIHINPQTIYNKDMTGVNALGVHFSPFRDSFDDTILDGALINDYEAMIDYNKLRSYNDNTVIKKEVVSKSIK